MVDVGLESTIADSEPPADLTVEEPTMDDEPPAFQKFRSPASGPSRFSAPARRYSATESELGIPPPSSVDTNLHGAPSAAQTSDGEIFKHDAFFAWIYLIAQASLFATFVLVYLHTSTPPAKSRSAIPSTLHYGPHLTCWRSTPWWLSLYLWFG